MQQSKSHALFTASQELIPGGVNSPVRAFRGVHGEPRFIAKADKAYIYDADGNAYIDFVGSWGPMILGHNHPKVAQAVTQAVTAGLSYGAPTAIELEMAQHLTRVVPNLDMVRMVSSGTEATMSAIRLARGYTQRNKIIKFDGCYHGHSDSLLVKAGSGVLTFGVPGSSGVTEGVAQDTLIAQYNDLDSVQALFAANPQQIACVIVEPVAGNMNCVPPTQGFLQGLRSLCSEHGTVLIFDEVMTGFRCGYPGAQTVYNVDADLITLGKIIGAGMPVGAFGGKREIMQHLAPLGGVYQAGTLSGNPVAMAAGLALLRELDDNQQAYYNQLAQQTEYLVQGLQKIADANKVPFTTTRVGSMFGIYFRSGEVQSFADVQQSDIERFKKFHELMLEQGVYFAPSAFEAGFVSLEHTTEVLDKVLEVAQVVFPQL